MDSLERALINFHEKGFKKGYEDDCLVSFYKQLRLAEGRIEEVLYPGADMHPLFFQVVGHFFKGPDKYRGLEPGTYSFMIPEAILNESPIPKDVRRDVEAEVEKLFAQNELDEKIRQLLSDFKTRLELPQDADIGMPLIKVEFNLRVQTKGQNFEETYNRFKLTTERFGYKID